MWSWFKVFREASYHVLVGTSLGEGILHGITFGRRPLLGGYLFFVVGGTGVLILPVVVVHR